MKLFKKAVLAVATLVLALAAFVAPVKHAQVDAAEPYTLYLTPNANWKQSNARFAVYSWDGGDKWINMTDADKDGIYEATIPAGVVNVIFVRMNPSATDNNWNNKWNQTADLKYDGTNNHYIVKEGTWDKGGGAWTVMGSSEPVVPDVPKAPDLPAGVETFPVYFSNTKNWTEVYVYTWNATDDSKHYQGEWPGTKIELDTATGYYKLDKAYAGEKIIFNNGNGGDGNQTDDLTVVDATTCLYNGTAWATLGGEVVEPEVPEVGNLDLGLIGSFNSWAANINLTWNAETERYELVHEFKAGDQWKIRFGTSWDGALGWHGEDNDASVRKYCEEGKENNKLNGNICIKADAAGKYLVWVDSTAKHIGMEYIWELDVKVGFQVGTKDEAKALRLVAEFNLDAEKLESFDSEIQFRVTKGTKADTREVTRLYSSVNPMNGGAEFTGAYYAVLTYVNIPAGQYLVEVLVDGVVAASVTAKVA